MIQIKSFDQLVCLSGLPRTGSTLLSSLLSQNPTIHSEGYSGLCELMWQTEKTCESINHIFASNNRLHTSKDIISQLPHSYYKNNSSQEKIQPLTGVQVARESNSNRFIFVSYQDLVENTSQTLKRIYSFCGWPPFIHNTNNVDTKYVERDDFYRLKGMQVDGLKGMHDVRKKLNIVVTIRC